MDFLLLKSGLLLKFFEILLPNSPYAIRFCRWSAFFANMNGEIWKVAENGWNKSILVVYCMKMNNFYNKRTLFYVANYFQ